MIKSARELQDKLRDEIDSTIDYFRNLLDEGKKREEMLMEKLHESEKKIEDLEEYIFRLKGSLEQSKELEKALEEQIKKLKE